MSNAAALNLNLADPSVRRMMGGGEDSGLAQPGKRQMVQLAGDEQHGMMSTRRLDTAKVEVLVSYRGRHGDFDLTVDVYAIPGQPVELHMICPRCRHQNRISAERKKIEFNPGEARPYTFVDGSRMPTNGGSLDVEPFECGWEMPEAGEHKSQLKTGDSIPEHAIGSVHLCRMKLAIDRSVAKDA